MCAERIAGIAGRTGRWTESCAVLVGPMTRSPRPLRDGGPVAQGDLSSRATRSDDGPPGRHRPNAAKILAMNDRTFRHVRLRHAAALSLTAESLLSSTALVGCVLWRVPAHAGMVAQGGVCYVPSMATKALQDVLRDAETWPEEDQEELATAAREIQARRTGVYVMATEERAAVREGLAQADRGAFVPDDEMDAFWMHLDS